jgi:hypothetical protein
VVEHSLFFDFSEINIKSTILPVEYKCLVLKGRCSKALSDLGIKNLLTVCLMFAYGLLTVIADLVTVKMLKIQKFKNFILNNFSS